VKSDDVAARSLYSVLAMAQIHKLGRDWGTAVAVRLGGKQYISLSCTDMKFTLVYLDESGIATAMQNLNREWED